MLRTKAAATHHTLTNPWCRDALAAFTERMIVSGRAKKVALCWDDHGARLRVLDRGVEHPDDLTAETLIGLFGLDGLRKGSLLIGALVETGLITNPPVNLLRDAAERQRQQKLLAGCETSWYHGVLCRFHAVQTRRLERSRAFGWTGARQRYGRRSVTQDLKAAHCLLKDLPPEIDSLHQLHRIHLDTFLYTHRGYRAAIGNFIDYLRRQERMFLRYKIPTTPSGSRLANVLGSPKIEPLIERWADTQGHQAKYALGALLMLTYAQPAGKIVMMKIGDFTKEADGRYAVRFADVPLPLDDRVAVMLERHLKHRPATAGDYLFPGRRFETPMSESSLSAYLRRHDVTAAELFATGIYRLYVQGLRQPQVLVRGLGISNGTANAYLEAFDARLIDETTGWVRGKRRIPIIPETTPGTIRRA